MSGMFGELVRYDAMCRAIAEAYEVDEVKDIRDKAIAIQVYSRQAHNTEAERQACEIRLRAESKAGQLLREMDKAKGAREPGTNRGTTQSKDVTASKLGDLGITKQQSSDWQKLAAVPEEQFEEALASSGKLTTGGLITVVSLTKVRLNIESDALWICGRLREFEEMGLLERDPADVLRTMTAPMRGRDPDELGISPSKIATDAMLIIDPRSGRSSAGILRLSPAAAAGGARESARTLRARRRSAGRRPARIVSTVAAPLSVPAQARRRRA